MSWKVSLLYFSKRNSKTCISSKIDFLKWFSNKCFNRKLFSVELLELLVVTKLKSLLNTWIKFVAAFTDPTHRVFEFGNFWVLWFFTFITDPRTTGNWNYSEWVVIKPVKSGIPISFKPDINWIMQLPKPQNSILCVSYIFLKTNFQSVQNSIRYTLPIGNSWTSSLKLSLQLRHENISIT